MTTFLALAAGGYVTLVTVLYLGQRLLLYRRDHTVPEPRDHGVAEMEAVRIPVGDGIEILSWWHPPREPGRPVVVYFHGNAGHIGERGYKARRMIDAGFGVLLAGYRYNAGAGGAPSEAALLSDARIAMQHVLDLGYEMERLVLYGESLGSGIAVALAADHDVAGLILETPYSSIAEVAQAHYWYTPAKWLIRQLASFLTDTKIPDLNSGLRAFRRDVGRQYLHLLPPGFSCVTTLTMAFLANGYSVKYVPIEYSKRAGRSKFHWWADTRRYLTQVIRLILGYNPLKIFIPLGLLLTVGGFGKLLYDIVDKDWRVATNTIVLLFAAFQVVAIGLLADLIGRVSRATDEVEPARR